MATEKQIQANRTNAKKSTGPRTDEGKSRASQNSLKHGLLARDAVVPGEDPADYEAQIAALEDDIQPEGAVECELVRQMADAQWRMRRLARIESGYLAACTVKSSRHAEHFRTHLLQLGYEGETLLLGHSMLGETQALTHFARYDAHLGRRFERALQQIANLREARKRAQAAQQSSRRTPTIPTDPTAPPPPDTAKTPPPENCETNPNSPNQNEINEIAPSSPASLHPAHPETEQSTPHTTAKRPPEHQIAPPNGSATPQNHLPR